MYRYLYDIDTPTWNYDVNKLICDKLTQSNGGNSDIDRVDHFMLYTNKVFQIYLPSGSWTDLPSAKLWLANNPITVQYKLATPTIEILDTESQIALNSLETFNGVTYIEVDSMVKPKAIKSEFGTSKVGAYTLKALNIAETNAVRLSKLSDAL